jgi:hypothetical protein
MINARALAISIVGTVISVHGLDAQDLPKYRNFELGSNLASVATLAGVDPSEAKTIHQRPAIEQDLEWRLSRWVSGSTASSTDPVEKIVFSFYNDQLFRLVVDYGTERTEGMTDADIVAALSATYGAPLKPTGRLAPRGASRLGLESGATLARWGDAEQSVVVYRTSTYGTAFRLMVTEPRLDDLARKAEAQAIRLDVQEAPRREIARQNKEVADGRAAREKARLANRAAFRP